ncbi:root hair defective 3 gtp-binding protein, partial [Cystoisospora suis]
MLAIYRCQELKAQVLASKTHEVTSMLSKVQRKELKDFSQFPSWISQIANSALSEYMEHACRYQKDICMRIEKELIDGLTGAMQPIVDELLMQTRDSLMKDFSQKLASFFTISKTDSTLTIAGEPVELVWESFGSTCSEKLKRDVKKRFLASAEMYRVKLHDTQSDSSSLFLHFSTDLILDGMLRISSKDVESVREAQQTSLENLIKKRCDEKFLGVADGLASREFSAEKYWETCRAKVSSVSTDCSDRYMKSYLGLASYSSSSFNAVAMNISDLSSPENRGTSSSPSSSSPRVPEKTDTHLVEGTGEKIDQEEEEEEEKEKKKETFRTRCRVIALMALRKQMESIVANLHIIVVDRFQTFFSYDENDQPRQWECLPPETLQRLFVEAKEQAIVLLSTFSSMNIIPLDLSRPSLYPPDFTPPSSPPSSTKPSSS